MPRPGNLKLRLLATAALLLGSAFAGLGFVHWSDPASTIQELVGAPLSVVRTEELATGELLQGAHRLTTTGGLELECVIKRPNTEERVPLVVVGLDSAQLFEAAAAWSGPHDCAVIFFQCRFHDEELLDLRHSSDRAAASFLAIRESMLKNPWLSPEPVHLVGQQRAAPAAFLASKQLPNQTIAWRLGDFPKPPLGFFSRLAHELAFGGSRSPRDPQSNQPPEALTLGLQWVEDRISRREAR